MRCAPVCSVVSRLIALKATGFLTSTIESSLVLMLTFVVGSLRGAEVESATGKASRPASVFSAGGAYADITPAHAMPNYNGNAVVPDENATPLRVQVLLCGDGEKKIAVVSIDCTFIGRDVVLRIRDALHVRLGIDPDNVCVGATHSHACPATTASFLTGALPDPQYLDLIVARVTQAAVQAEARMQPARIAAAKIPAPPVGVCRRRVSPAGQAYMTGTEPDASYQPESPIDDQLQYVLFEDADGKALGLIFNVACHNNMVSSVFSADMFGRAGDCLREKLGAIATVSLAAPSGDVNFRLPGGKKTYPDDRAAGQAIADAILASLPGVARRDGGKISVRSIMKEIPDRKYDPADFVYDSGRGTNKKAAEYHHERYAPEELAVRQRGATVCDVELQAIAFGNVAIVTNPAELFSIYGVTIKEASPFDVTIVASLSNGYCGYVPTPAAFEHGGYETYRTVYTSRLERDAGDQIVSESIKLLQSLATPSSGESGADLKR